MWRPSKFRNLRLHSSMGKLPTGAAVKGNFNTLQKWEFKLQTFLYLNEMIEDPSSSHQHVNPIMAICCDQREKSMMFFQPKPPRARDAKRGLVPHAEYFGLKTPRNVHSMVPTMVPNCVLHHTARALLVNVACTMHELETTPYPNKWWGRFFFCRDLSSTNAIDANSHEIDTPTSPQTVAGHLGAM